jgi:hypothetical protein
MTIVFTKMTKKNKKKEKMYNKVVMVGHLTRDIQNAQSILS